jgi:hypothetical protein
MAPSMITNFGTHPCPTEIKATNVLDTKSQSQSNANDYSVSATEYFIQPRFITFRLIYEL